MAVCSSVIAELRYMLVFDNKPIDGAHKLADALGLLGQL